MSIFSRNKLLAFIIVYLVIVLIAIPLTLINLKKQKTTQSSASASTVMSFSPATAQTTTGGTFPLDIMLDPGNNAVSFVTLDILFDGNKLALADTNALQVNTLAFPNIVEGPVYDPGRVRIKVSIGSDPTKAITTATKVGTLTLKGIGGTGGNPTQVQFGSATYILSVAPEDGATDNVLSSSQPAAVTIDGADLPTVTINPTATGQPTGQVTESPTVTVEPTPVCTPLPTQCTEDSTDPVCTNPPAGGFCTGEPTPTSGGPTPTTAPVSCTKNDPADIVLILDGSTSMMGDKITNAKTSAKSFINLLGNDVKNNVGLIVFNKDARTPAPLTNNTQSVASAIDNITLVAGTCIKCGIDEADKAFQANGRPDAKKIAILLTDGRANAGGGAGADKKIAAEAAAINQLKNAKTQNLTLYTIGIGADVNPNFLQQLSQMSGGLYYFAASPIEIDDSFAAVYDAVSDAICNAQPLPTGLQGTIPVDDTGTAGGGIFSSVTLIMILLIVLPLILLMGHFMF